MASIRGRRRSDGTIGYAVLYTIDGRQTSVTFDTEDSATKFKTLVDTVGAARAMQAWGIADTPKAAPKTRMTLVEYLNEYIEQLTGVTRKTIDDYQRYIRRDITPFFGDLPLDALNETDIARWVKHLDAEVGNSPKTIHNKHGFLSGALSAAVPRLIPANPAAGRRLPQGDGDADEIRMLTKDEFNRLLEATTEYWRPLIEFMVLSGARWGEVSALKPEDVNRDTGEVRIRRAWKYSSDGYTVGPPKTKRSRRTINLPKELLNKLDYSHEWLFVNRTGGPVRYIGFRRRVWDKAVARAELQPPPTPHDLRHTCASWMLNGGMPPIVVSRHLGHESIQITVDIYGDVDRSTAKAAADFMGSELYGAGASPGRGRRTKHPPTV
jgi:integrase